MMKLACTLLILSILISSGYSFSLNVKNTDQNLRANPEKCYGAILDAGSSSTKVSVYEWVCRDIVSLPKLNPISKLFVKVSPGLSSFNKNIAGIAGYIQPLITKIKEIIPSELQASSPIMLGATAGMRLLSQEDQDAIIKESASILTSSGFLFAGQQWSRVITGQEEGVFLWISANYLMKSIIDHSKDTDNKVTTATTIDLGGASTQITFRLPKSELEHYNLSLPQKNDYVLYSVSYLGYGNDQARNSVVNLKAKDSKGTELKSGCYNLGYSYTDPDTKQLVSGTSDPFECVKYIRKFFAKKSCKSKDAATCSINGTYQPKVPTDGPIIAVSGINTAVNQFNISSPFHPDDLLKAAASFCLKSYERVQKEEPANPYVSTKCFLGLYAATLLSEAFNLNSYKIDSPGKVQGAEPAWSMGYLFGNIAKLNCDNQTTVPATSCPIPQLIQEQMENTISL